jgi:ABC-type phosphate transport system substrate-binding protein
MKGLRGVRLLRVLLPAALALFAAVSSGCGVSTKGAAGPPAALASATPLASYSHLPPRPVGLVQIDGHTTGTLTAGAVAAYQGLGARISVADNGEAQAFGELCAGRIDVVDSAQPISAAQLSVCERNGVQPVQFEVAADAVVLATRAEADVGTDCLTLGQVRKIFQAGSQITNWSQLGYYNIPLQVVGPAENSSSFNLFDGHVLGSTAPSLADLRGDYQALASEAAVGGAVVHGSLGTLGYVSFAYYLNHESELRPLEIDNESARPLLNCIFPSTSTAADGSFPLARQLLLTVGLADLRRPEVSSFMKLYLSRARQLAGEAGLVALPGSVLSTELGWLDGAQEPPVVNGATTDEAHPQNAHAASTTGGDATGGDATGGGGEGQTQGTLVPAGGAGDTVSSNDVPLSAVGGNASTSTPDQGSAQASSQPSIGGQ